MAEPTVQVPVSLPTREQLRDATRRVFADWYETNETGDGFVRRFDDALDALLSQPTPPAETPTDRDVLDRFLSLATCPDDASRLARLRQALNLARQRGMSWPLGQQTAEPPTYQAGWNDGHTAGFDDGWGAGAAAARASTNDAGLRNEPPRLGPWPFEGQCESTMTPPGSGHGYRCSRLSGHDGEHGTPAGDQWSDQPRIEDLAPGTTFRARLLKHIEQAQSERLWFVYAAQHDGHKRRVKGDHGIDWTVAAIDPSTIRNVTPPAVTS